MEQTINEQTITKQGRKAYRMEIEDTEIISDSLYNLIIGAVILYGLAVNVFMCRFVPVEALLATGDTEDVLGAVSIAYFFLAIIGSLISDKSHNPLISFLGYNLVVVPFGLLISIYVFAFGGMGSPVVIKAFLFTAVITLVMVILSGIFPGFFAKLGGVLCAALIGVLVNAVIIRIVPAGSSLFAMQTNPFVCAVIFSLYIGYDYYKAQSYPRTIDNAVDSALDIYMDIVVLFMKLLSIFGSKSDD